MRPFRIKKIWVYHPNFKSIVDHCWSSNNNNLLQASHAFQTMATDWSNSTFGDIFKIKKKLLACLNGVQNSAAYSTSKFLHDLETSPIKDYNAGLKVEEEYWKL